MLGEENAFRKIKDRLSATNGISIKCSTPS